MTNRFLSLLGSFVSYISVTALMIIEKLLGKKILVISVEELFFIPFVLPIFYEICQKTNKISIYISSTYSNSSKFVIFSMPTIKFFNPNINKSLFLVDMFLSPSIYANGPKNALKIHISHNQPVKYQALPEENFRKYNAHFLIGPLHRKQTEQTIRIYKIFKSSIKLYNIGYPKSDLLLNSFYDREKILLYLKLKVSSKTIIYAPSWEEGLSLRCYGIDIIKQILKIPNINLIVKLHPMSYVQKDHPQYFMYTGGIDWEKKLSIFNHYSNFRNIIDDNVDPYLEVSDVMVTDISGVALEYILLDRPIIYIDCPEYYNTTLKHIYKLNGRSDTTYIKNDPKANAGRHTGLLVKEINELSGMLKVCLNNPDINSVKRRKFAMSLRYNPGKSSKVAANKILSLLKL